MQIAIIGAGGHAKVIADAILAAGHHMVFGFFDDDASLWRNEVLGFPVMGPIDTWRNHSIDALVVGIGDNANRRNDVRSIEEIRRSDNFTTVVHPRATLGKGVVLGEGTSYSRM